VELPKSLKLVIFDFDGTLFHLDDMDWDWMRTELGLLPGENLGDTMQRLRLNDPARLQPVTDAELRAVGDRRLAPDIADALHELALRYRIAVLTRNSRHAVLTALEGIPVAKHIHIIGREDTEHLKPHPEGVHALLKTFDVLPKETLLVGDTYHDVAAGRAAGVPVAIVMNPRLAYRPEGADHYIESVAILPALLRHES
jgi:HAD superfamily hydrolase (TIGR01509 family)